MTADEQGTEPYAGFEGHRNHIVSKPARAIFERLVERLSAVPGMQLRRTDHGAVHSLGLFAAGGRHYDIGVNKQRLSFYVRQPQTTHRDWDLARFRNLFPDANGRGSGVEIRFSLRTDEDVERVLKLIVANPPR